MSSKKKNDLTGVDFAVEETESYTVEQIVNLEESYPEYGVTDEILTETIELDVRQVFCEQLEGSDFFKQFVYDYLKEMIKVKLDEYDLNYYDWMFHQHLRDAFLEFSRVVVRNIEKHPEIYEHLKKRFENLEDVNFMHIFEFVSNNNKDKNFGRFVLNGVKNNA